MNWRTSLWLTAAALVAILFVILIERPTRLALARATSPHLLLPSFQPATISGIRIQTTNNVITLSRTNSAWAILNPEFHPAQASLVETLLGRIATLQGRSILSTADLRTRPQATADFGLNPPAATLFLDSPQGRIEILLGIRTLNGAHVHFQVSGIPGIFITDAAFLDALPPAPDGWRDTTLLPLDRLAFDRIRVTSGGTAFALTRDPTNGVWEMLEPRPARADSTRVGVLLRQLGLLQISRFLPVTSAPTPEIAGLRPPQYALSLARGTNEVFGLSVGTSLTNAGNPSVYASRPTENDTLVVPAEAQELLRLSYKDLLDRRLVRFDRNSIREIAFEGPESFQLTWQNDTWRLAPSDLPADPALVERLFNHLAMLEMIDIAKEVVTDLDLATYGLAQPARRLTLRTQPGNTNSPPAARLETGTLRDNRIFARIPGEAPVYLVNPGDLDEIPTHAWELRDRSLWRFDAPQIASITARHDGIDWTVRRQGTNDWAVPPGGRNELNPFALDEALHRLGESRLLSWRGIGPARAAALGVDRGPEITLDFRGAPTNPPLKLRFGKAAPGGRRYATTTLPDGSQPVFEILGTLFDDLWRELGMAADTDPATSP